MSNFQTNLYQPNLPYQVSYGNNPVSSKGINEIKVQDNMAGKVADKYDVTENPASMSRSFLYSLLMSMGFVKLTNWLMTPKKITDTMTQMDSYQSSRLYKLGQKVDGMPLFQKIVNHAGKVKSWFAKIPMPQFVREIGSKIKLGSTAPWDKTGMYSLGKSAEAMRETATLFSQVDEAIFNNLKLSPENLETLKALMKKVKLGKIDTLDAYKQLEPMIKNISAKTLSEIKVPGGIIPEKLVKLMGTRPDLNLSASKARFFAGAKASGPVGKAFNKFIALFGEASGGGVLGGTSALLMNAAGLMTGFNSAMKAEKGDKLKAFMEDYIGFTIGGYLMSMVVGKWFNKAMALSECGMDLKAVEKAAAKMNLEGVKRVQDVVIGYNKEFKQAQAFKDILKKYKNNQIVEGSMNPLKWVLNKLTGKMTISKATNIMKKYGVEVADASEESFKKALLQGLKGKSAGALNAIRKDVVNATKSTITLGSVFKQAGFSGKMNQLGRWLVQKPLATAAKLLSTGRYTALKNGNFIGNAFRTLKRTGGGIFRMWLVGFVLVEPFRKAFVKLSHKIFGKPKHSVLDEEENQNKPSQQPQIAPNQSQPSQNLVDLYLQNMPKNPQNKPNQLQSESVNHLPYLKQDTATYVPTEELTQESYVDPSITQDLLTRRDLAMKHSYAIEKNAMKLLNGDFGI